MFQNPFENKNEAKNKYQAKDLQDKPPWKRLKGNLWLDHTCHRPFIQWMTVGVRQEGVNKGSWPTRPKCPSAKTIKNTKVLQPKKQQNCLSRPLGLWVRSNMWRLLRCIIELEILNSRPHIRTLCNCGRDKEEKTFSVQPGGKRPQQMLSIKNVWVAAAAVGE